MEKQPETEEQSFEFVREKYKADNQFPLHLNSTDYFEICKGYRDRRQNIEAQQVAGMSFEDCLKQVKNRYDSLSLKEWLSDLFISHSDKPEVTFLKESAEMYASACVAEKERQFQNLKNVHQSERIPRQQFEENNASLRKRIQELESSQAVSDEEINKRAEEFTRSQFIEHGFFYGLVKGTFVTASKEMRSKLAPPSPDNK